MARRTQQDAAKAKAQKQKKILIGASVLFVALLAIQGPKTLNMLKGSRNAPTVDASVTPPSSTATQTAPAPISPAPTSGVTAPTLAAPVTTTETTSSGSQLVSSVEPTADPGQLEQFFRFASKDPFAVQATGSSAGPKPGSSTTRKRSSGGASTSSGSGTRPPVAATPSPGPGAGSGSGAGPQPSGGTIAPVPTSAVISLDGILMAVTVGGSFPSSNPLFLLGSLTATTAKISIVGGSYADGSAALTLVVGKPVTLQNTADGSRYTLVLEPQGTPAPAGSTPAATTPSLPVTPTPTAPSTSTTTSFGG